MKKNILLVFVLLIELSNVYATHNKAADISYTHISGYTYKITIRTFTNTYNTTADRCELTVCMGDGNCDTARRINGPSTINCPGGHDGVIIAPYTKLNIYEATHTYPGAGTYQITMEDPNRSAGICNVPNSVNTSFFLQAELVINLSYGDNNGPGYNSVPLVSDTIGIIQHYNPLTIDADGDSLYYQLVPAMGNGTNVVGFTLPAASNSFSIDSLTGTVTWDSPVTICTYVYDIKITEWRKVGGSRNYIGSSMQEIWNTVISYPLSTGVSAQFNSNHITVYPNPSSDVINFSIENKPGDEIYVLIINNEIGQTIRTIDFNNDSNRKYSVNGLSPGMYFYTLKTVNRPVSQGKFVVLTALSE